MAHSFWSRTSFRLALACLCSSACSDGVVDIGNDQPEILSGLAAYTATWVGYIEAFTFASGSDRVELTVTESGTGHIRFGDAPLLPRPTDPDVGPDLGPAELSGGGGDPITIIGNGGPVLPIEGFQYPLYQVRVEDTRLRTEFIDHDVYSAWCALQTPYYQLVGYAGPTSPDAEVCAEPPTEPLTPEAVEELDCLAPIYSYQCTRGNGALTEEGCFTFESSSGTPIQTPIDCEKLELCSDTCNCDANGCFINPRFAPIQIDGALQDDGNELNATILIENGRRLLLTRQ